MRANFPLDKEVEVVAVNKRTHLAQKRIMAYGDALKLRKSKYYYYYYYQVGYSAFKEEKV